MPKDKSVRETLAAKKTYTQKDIDGILELGRLTGVVVGFQTSADKTLDLTQRVMEITTKMTQYGKELAQVTDELIKEAKELIADAKKHDKQAVALAKKVATS